MVDIGFLLGALVPTGLLAALFVWLPGRYIKPIGARALVANVLALFVATLIGGYGLADGGPPRFDDAFFGYWLPQAIWLVVWILTLRDRQAKAQAAARGP
jgi:hypothetical protein